MKKFPEGFLWGAALSGPQTEGYSLKEGKSASTWDYWFKENPERNTCIASYYRCVRGLPTDESYRA